MDVVQQSTHRGAIDGTDDATGRCARGCDHPHRHGAVAVTLMGRPDETITTGITTAVIMVVAAISPHDARR